MNGSDIDRRRGIGRFVNATTTGLTPSIGGVASDPNGPTARHQRDGHFFETEVKCLGSGQYLGIYYGGPVRKFLSG